MSASARSTARSGLRQLHGRHLAAVHRSSPIRAGTTEPSASRSSSRCWSSRAAGPLVHEHLLELDRQCAPTAGVAPVHPAAELATAEADVLPHVQAATADASPAELVDAPVGDMAPAGAVERTGSDVHVGIRRGRRRWRVGAVAAVVVRVHVEHEERSARGEHVQPCASAPGRTRRRARASGRARRAMAARATGRDPTRPRAAGTPRPRRGRLRSTSNRERCTTTVEPPTAVRRSVNGSSSRRRVASSTAVRDSDLGPQVVAGVDRRRDDGTRCVGERPGRLHERGPTPAMPGPIGRSPRARSPSAVEGGTSCDHRVGHPERHETDDGSGDDVAQVVHAAVHA